MTVPSIDQLASFGQVVEQITAAIAGLDDTAFHFTPDDGGWSIHNILIHLADSEAVGYWRFRKTVAEPGSQLDVYDEAAWATQLFYARQSRELALNLFTLLRAANTAFLRALPGQAWDLTSVHVERGELSVYDLFETYKQHAEIHLQQIENVKRLIP